MELKTQIIQAASELFFKHGIRRVSIDDICNELHISKKTFYEFFPKKENLVDEFIGFHNRDMISKRDKALKNKNAIEALLSCIKEARKYMENVSELVERDVERYYPNLYEKYICVEQQELYDIFERNLRRGIEDGYYREDLDIELLASFFISVIKREKERNGDTLRKRFHQKRVLEFFFDMIMRLIFNEEGQKFIKENYNKE
jgi:AcrR family transcriptional regulator